MVTYIAFLRGVNVGGVVVKMDALKKVFVSLGFVNVETVLASGNVRFESPKMKVGVLEARIEAALKSAFKRDMFVLVRTRDELRKLVAWEPFAKVKVGPKTRLFVSFLKDAERREECSVLDLADQETVDMMAGIEKKYGKTNVTTRNWNTVLKMAQ